MRYAVAGATPFYRIPAYAIDHHPADIGVPTGHWRSGAHSYTAFFTECFIDELAHVAGTEPLSFRIGMLGGDAAAGALPVDRGVARRLGGRRAGQRAGHRLPQLSRQPYRGAGRGAYRRRAAVGGRPASSRRSIAGASGQSRSRAPADRGRADLRHGGGARRARPASPRISPMRAASRDLGLPRLADTPDITVELIAQRGRSRRRQRARRAAGRARDRQCAAGRDRLADAPPAADVGDRMTLPARPSRRPARRDRRAADQSRHARRADAARR